jgi:hypothetical protein
LKIVNSILMNNWRGLNIDSASVSPGAYATAPVTANFDEDSLVYRNNTIAGDFSSTWTGTTYNGTKSLAYSNSATRSRATNVIYGNDSVNTCSLLLNPWAANQDSADWRPNVAGAGTVLDTLVSVTQNINLNLQSDGTLFTPAQEVPFAATISNTTLAPTNGTFSIRISKPSGWLLEYSATATSAPLGTPVTVRNSDFTFAETGSFITATSKPGVILSRGTPISIGFKATRRAATSGGSNQNLDVSTLGGGDATRQTVLNTLSANGN